MNQSPVVLFMKGSPDTPRCGFSRRMVALLNDQNVLYTHFDILTDEDVRQGKSSTQSSIAQVLCLGLKKLNDWPTFPQLTIKGEFVGGLDVVQEMVDNGELKALLA
jgi:Grx4 family monothiol glutaredoxin